MALAVPQTAHFAPTSGTNTVTATLLSATVVGNVLVAVVSGYDSAPGPTSVTDSRGNTWVRDYTSAPATGGLLWYAVYSTTLTAAGTPHTVTFTQTGVLIANIDVAEVSGMAASGRFEAAVLGGATSVAPYTAGPTGTLTQVGEIVFAAVSVDSGEVSATLTQDATWVLIGEQQDGSAFIGSVVYKIVAATTPVTHVWTGTYASAPWSTVILSYKAAAAVTTGTIAVTEAADTPAIVGSSTPPAGTFVGTVAVTEADDTPAIAGSFTAGTNITGVLAVTEAADTPAIAGTFTALTAPFRYPVAVSGRKFVDQVGAIVLLKDVSSWGMIQSLSNAEITEALTGTAARHFNCAIAAICGARVFPDWTPYTNKAGQPFFTGTPWQTSLGAAWATTDHFIAECTRLGLTAGLSLFISYGDSGPRAEIEAASNAQMQARGVEVATRYASVPNIVWTVEADTGWQPTDTIGQRCDAFFQGIRSVEGATPRLIVAEPYLDGTSYEMYISKQLDHGTSGGYQYLKLAANSPYFYTANSVEGFDNNWNQSGATTLPVWDCEPPYVGAAHYSGTPSIERQNIRERTLVTVIRGGVGLNWGHESWWPFGKQGLFSPPETWQQVMTAVDAFEAQYAWDLLDTYCLDPAWAPDNASVVTGVGTGDTKAGVGGNGAALLAYFPNSRAVTVNTTVLTGTGNVRLRWWDPTTGTYTTIAASEAQAPARVISSFPANHADGTSDFVLVVDLADTVTGVVAALEGDDSPAIAGTFTAPTGIVGTIAVTEDADTPAIVAAFSTGPVTGVIAAVEANDTPVIVGFIPGAPVSATGPLIVSVEAWPPPLTVTVEESP